MHTFSFRKIVAGVVYRMIAASVFSTAIVILAFWGYLPALAQTDVAIDGTVPTTVSSNQSSFVADVQVVPADGSSRVTLTAILVDSNNDPVPDARIKVVSSRGEADVILCYQGETLTSLNTTAADSNGMAKCVASSQVPGQATFSALIDDQLTLNDKPIVTFTALPILQNLTITVTLPGGKKITLIKPPVKPTPVVINPRGTEPSHLSGTGQLINTEFQFDFPLWLFLLFLLNTITGPILLILFIRLNRKVNRRLAPGQSLQANRNTS